MSNIGIKISQPGFDVKTAADNELEVKSSYPALKIHSTGSGSTTFTSNEGSITLTTHGFIYKPFFLIWVDIGSGYQLVSFSTTVGDYNVTYLGTSNADDDDHNGTLELAAIIAYTGGFFGDETLPPNKTIDYAWVIFYDPIL